MRIEWKPPRSPFSFSSRFEGGTRKSSKRLAALIASSLRFARGAMLRNSRTTPSQNSVSVRLSPNDRIIRELYRIPVWEQEAFGLIFVAVSPANGGLRSNLSSGPWLAPLPDHTTVQLSIHCTPKRSVSLP